MPVAIETYNYELQLTLVARNRGLSIVPERILTRSHLRSRLRALHIVGLEFPLKVWMAQGLALTGCDPVILELSRTLAEKL